MRINNAHYNVKVMGQGAPLLLLHGFTGSLETWRPFFKLWASSYTLIMIDILGHGKTDSPQDVARYSIEAVSADIKEILQRLRIEKAHILGYSMGGRLALTFALKYPQYISSLIMESSSPGLETEQERNERQRKDELLADFIEREGIEAFVNHWEKIPLFSTQELLPALIKQRIRRQRLANNNIGLANSLRGMGTGKQPSLWGNIAKLKKSVYIIAGEKDGKYCCIAQKMKNKISQAQVSIVEKAGHNIHVEKEDIFGKMVVEFLNNLN